MNLSLYDSAYEYLLRKLQNYIPITFMYKRPCIVDMMSLTLDVMVIGNMTLLINL